MRDSVALWRLSGVEEKCAVSTICIYTRGISLLNGFLRKYAVTRGDIRVESVLGGVMNDNLYDANELGSTTIEYVEKRLES